MLLNDAHDNGGSAGAVGTSSHAVAGGPRTWVPPMSPVAITARTVARRRAGLSGSATLVAYGIRGRRRCDDCWVIVADDSGRHLRDVAGRTLTGGSFG